MPMADRAAKRIHTDAVGHSASQELEQFLAAPMASPRPPIEQARIDGVRIGKLVGFADNGATPLVTFAGQAGPAAQAARATLDLRANDIGKSAVLMFDEGDASRPIVVGCLHEPDASGLSSVPEQVEIEADGKRLLITAKDQVVLRCGKSSLTLTKEGKVIIKGAYVSNESSGVLRLRGGSVQIN
jgi:hypothetical protein